MTHEPENLTLRDFLEILQNIPEEHRDEFFDILNKEITSEIDQEILKDLKKMDL